MDKDNNEFGEKRFYKALEDNFNKKPKEIITSVIAEVSKFTGNIEQHDDITMIIIKIL